MYIQIESQSSMLEKFRRIFSKPESSEEMQADDELMKYENPNFLTDPEKIFKLLCDIELSSPLCTIQVEGANQDFSSSILGVKADKSALILDELTPIAGNAILQRSKAFKLLVFHKGIHISFTVSGVETGFAHGISYYKAAMPARIFYPQRRRAPRIEIRTIDIPFNGFSQKTGLSVGGYLYDLSRGGAGVEMPANRARVQRGDIINRCQMSFEDYVMDFNFNVRFVKPAMPGMSRMQIGGMFENVSSKSEAKLSYFITSLERYEIRKQKS
jgi:c-di-GMP-binding flagellar brake protein YcgR